MSCAMRWLGGLGLFACVCAWSLLPAHATGFVCRITYDVAECQRAHDVVNKTIHADAGLSALSERLAAAYATLEARDPAVAAALKRDQRNWLGERDDQAWRVLSDPYQSADAVATLARLYQQRVAFLGHVDATKPGHGSPVLHALLAAIPSLPKGTDDVLGALQSKGLVALAPEKSATGIGTLTAALPAPPSSALSAALRNDLTGSDRLDSAYFTHSYLPAGRIGGVYTVAGTAECRSWQLFASQHGKLQPIKSPKVLNNCWNTAGHLAVVDGFPVAITQTTGIVTQSVDLQWQRWLDGKWGIPVRVHVRLDRALKVDVASCAASLDCALVRKAALKYAQRYDKRPLPTTLASTDGLSAKQSARFERMQTLAENLLRQVAASPDAVDTDSLIDNVSVLPQIGKRVFFSMDHFGKDANFFPVRVDGHLLLGCIGHGYIGWRQGGYWMVGFWQWQNGKLHSVAGVVIDRDNAGVLLVARVKPHVAVH